MENIDLETIRYILHPNTNFTHNEYVNFHLAQFEAIYSLEERTKSEIFARLNQPSLFPSQNQIYNSPNKNNSSSLPALHRKQFPDISKMPDPNIKIQSNLLNMEKPNVKPVPPQQYLPYALNSQSIQKVPITDSQPEVKDNSYLQKVNENTLKFPDKDEKKVDKYKNPGKLIFLNEDISKTINLELNSSRNYYAPSSIKANDTVPKAESQSDYQKTGQNSLKIFENNEKKVIPLEKSSTKVFINQEPKEIKAKSPNKELIKHNRPSPVEGSNYNKKNIMPSIIPPENESKFKADIDPHVPKSINTPSKPKEIDSDKSYAKKQPKNKSHAAKSLNISALPEPNPLLYNTDDMSYENLLRLDENEYDPGKGFSFEILSCLNQFSFIPKESIYNTCNVCQDNLSSGQMVSLLKCGHIFHYDCIYEWLTRKKKCALNCELLESDFID